MASIPEMAFIEAERLGLDLSVQHLTVPAGAFSFGCLDPKADVLAALATALEDELPWVIGMPLPVLTYHPDTKEYRIMDGMMRICAAQMVGMKVFPALVANGDTYDALESILDNGYYGEDFVEMLAMTNEDVRKNLESRDGNRLAGR